MAQMAVESKTLVVSFAKWERVFVRRAELRVPLEQVARVSYLRQPVPEIRGVRSGLLVSGLLKVGVWFSPKTGRRLVSVRRGVAAVRLELAGHERYKEVVVSTPKAAELAVEIRPGAHLP